MALLLASTTAGSKVLVQSCVVAGQDVQMLQVEADEPGGLAAAAACLPRLHILHEGLMSQPAVRVDCGRLVP
jgi:hypothetical protein